MAMVPVWVLLQRVLRLPVLNLCSGCLGFTRLRNSCERGGGGGDEGRVGFAAKINPVEFGGGEGNTLDIRMGHGYVTFEWAMGT